MTLGIDIGGTNISFGLVEDGKVVQGFSVPSFSRESTQEETLDYLSAQIRKLITPAVRKIGIGVPSVVDVKRELSMTPRTSPPGRKCRSRRSWRSVSTSRWP